MRLQLRPGRDPSPDRRLRASVAAGVALLCAALVAGCVAGTPFDETASASSTTIDAAQVDTQPTGSIKPASDAPLDQVLAPADHAAVLTALGAALDPQSPGAPVTWTAAGGQGRGEAKPTGMARTEGDEICRPYALEGVGVDGKFTATGSACRNKRGDWRVKTLTQGKPA